MRAADRQRDGRGPAGEARPLMLYDGDCGFCQASVDRWRRVTGDAIEFTPYQNVAHRYPNIPRERFAEAVHLIEPDGRTTAGAHAVFRAWSLAGRRRWALWLYEHVPGVRAVTQTGYRFIARHRGHLSRATACAMPSGAEAVAYAGAMTTMVPPAHSRARSVFLRSLAVIYAIAFWSLSSQIIGLAGANGILPAGSFLEAVARNHGVERYHLVPTLCWFNAGDAMLSGLCYAGVGLAVLLFVGIAPVAVSFLLWAFYLSLTVVCGRFLQYQWEALLLETGFLAIFFSPLSWRMGSPRAAPPSRVVIWLLRWLMFRFMVLSGLVKLFSGDKAWLDFTALGYHYETQPIPNPLAWYAHQAPMWWQQGSTAIMFLIELGVPLLIIFRRGRIIAFWAFALLQIMIAATGNYGYFNLLTLVLCIPLLDDNTWPLRRRTACAADEAPSLRAATGRRWPLWITAPLATVIVAVSLNRGVWRLTRYAMPGTTLVSEWVQPFESINSYGLFAVMTKSRPEIVIEGSRDGRAWLEYEFKYKAGDVNRRPPIVAPHMPRLDWQMWFAALGRYEGNPWFARFCNRLLQGSPEVLSLLAHNPFPDEPPRFIRATLYDYHFTDAQTKAATGAWWRRENLRPYGPVLQLRRSPAGTSIRGDQRDRRSLRAADSAPGRSAS